MTDFDYIKWILNEDFLQKEPHDLTMIEDKGDKLCKQEVLITKRDRHITNIALYRYDIDTRDHLPFFAKGSNNSPKSLTKFCDYVILVEKDSELTIMLVEMKRGVKGEYDEQIKASKLFMQYVLSSAERIKGDNGMDDFSATKVKFRRILLELAKSNKQHTKKNTLELNKKSEEVIKYKCHNRMEIRDFL